MASEKIEGNEEPVTHNPNEIYFAFWGSVFRKKTTRPSPMRIGMRKMCEKYLVAPTTPPQHTPLRKKKGTEAMLPFAHGVDGERFTSLYVYLYIHLPLLKVGFHTDLVS